MQRWEKVKIRTNAICAACDKGCNCISGRFCTLLNKYVEYDKEPKCKESITNNINTNI